MFQTALEKGFHLQGVGFSVILELKVIAQLKLYKLLKLHKPDRMYKYMYMYKASIQYVSNRKLEMGIFWHIHTRKEHS